MKEMKRFIRLLWKEYEPSLYGQNNNRSIGIQTRTIELQQTRSIFETIFMYIHMNQLWCIIYFALLEDELET